MGILDYIYATSGMESAAVALAQAPRFVRVLRDIRERDFRNPYSATVCSAADREAWDAEHAQSDRIVLREGEVVPLTGNGALAAAGLRWKIVDSQVRSYPGNPIAREPMLEILDGDEHMEALLGLGRWELEDGCAVTMTREAGITVDYSTRRHA